MRIPGRYYTQKNTAHGMRFLSAREIIPVNVKTTKQAM
jgi:hypothetical protein